MAAIKAGYFEQADLILDFYYTTVVFIPHVAVVLWPNWLNF